MNVYAIGMLFPRLATIYIWVVIALVCIGLPVLVVAYLLGFNKKLRNMSREWRLFRMEHGKLADEVQQLRQELKGTDPRTTSVNSKPQKEERRKK